MLFMMTVTITVQFSSVAQSCPTHRNPMNHSTLGLPVHHQLPEFTQTHVHWCHPTISSSVVTFSSCLQSFPASGSLQMSQFFASSGQSLGVSASTSVLPMNIQDWFPLGWTGLNSLLFKGLSSLLQHHSSKTSIQHSGLFMVEMSHPYMTTGKTTALNLPTLVFKVMSLLFNMLSRWS